ncbi:MAG: STAS domain-containing protein [Planctomycetota bacterium]|jgi:anti-anti-sigma factor|nr:STAS domain-containing protein [Planctomycetota bacterium]
MAELRIISQPLKEHTWMTSLAGRMDASNFNVIEDEFNRLLESGAKGVAIDVSDLEAVSSSGLGALINLHALLKERGGKLVMFSLPESLVGLADLLGVGDALLTVPGRNDANRELESIR